MVAVRLTYLPSRLGRVSMLPGWKSGACFMTISITALVNPASLRPRIFSGNAVGKARPTASSSGSFFPSCTHHLLLEFLIQPVHAAEYRAGLAIADRLAVQGHNGEHFLGRRGDPDFVCRSHLGLGHVLELHRHASGLRKLDHHVVGDARQDELGLCRREDHTLLDDEYVR